MSTVWSCFEVAEELVVPDPIDGIGVLTWKGTAWGRPFSWLPRPVPRPSAAARHGMVVRMATTVQAASGSRAVVLSGERRTTLPLFSRSCMLPWLPIGVVETGRVSRFVVVIYLYRREGVESGDRRGVFVKIRNRK